MSKVNEAAKNNFSIRFILKAPVNVDPESNAP